MARMLTPEERGPRPAWAYDARDRLGLSDAQVAAAIPGPRRGEQYDPATIRKAETGEEHMSRPLWKKLSVYYTELARERGIALDPLPGPIEATESGDTTAALVRAFEAAMAAQTKAIVEAIQSRDATLQGLLTELREYREQQGGLVETVVAALEQSAGGSPGGGRGGGRPGDGPGAAAGSR